MKTSRELSMDDKRRNTFYIHVGTRFLKGIMFIVCTMIDTKQRSNASQEYDGVDVIFIFGHYIKFM